MQPLVPIVRVATHCSSDDRNMSISVMPNGPMGEFDDLAKLLMIADRPVAVPFHVCHDDGDPGLVARREISEVLLGLPRVADAR